MYAPVARAHAAPRRFWIAASLTVLQPGLGHVYCGRARVGIAVWIAVLCALAAAATFWVAWLFPPDILLLVVALAWLTLDAVLIADVRRIIRADGALYQLRPVNHPLAYLGVALGLGVLPIVLAILLIGQRFVGAVELRTDAMFPRFLPGDALIYDRRAYADGPPRAGDLVVVSNGEREQLTRVIATGGQLIRLFDGRPSVAGHPITHAPLAQLRVPRFEGEARQRLAALEPWLEENQSRRYPVTYRPEPRARPTLTVRLAEDELYVLGDNRDAPEASPGRIPLSAVRGRPRCIWASYERDGRRRQGRAGLEVR